MKIHTIGLNGLSQTSRSASNLSLPKLNGGSFNHQHPNPIGLNWVNPEFDRPIVPGPGDRLEDLFRKFLKRLRIPSISSI